MLIRHQERLPSSVKFEICWTVVSKCQSAGVCERVLEDSKVGSCRSVCVWDTTIRVKWNLPQEITSVCFFFYKICHAVVVFAVVVVVYLPMANISNKLTNLPTNCIPIYSCNQISQVMCPDLIFHKNPLNARRADKCGQMYRHDKANRHFLRLSERPWKPGRHFLLPKNF